MTNPNSWAYINSSKLACIKQITARTHQIQPIHAYTTLFDLNHINTKDTDMQALRSKGTTFPEVAQQDTSLNEEEKRKSGSPEFAGDWPESSDTTRFVRFLCRMLFSTFPVVLPCNHSFELALNTPEKGSPEFPSRRRNRQREKKWFSVFLQRIKLIF